MQDVVIRIKGDSSDIIKLGEELKKLGKVDADNAKQFEENNKKQKKATKEQSSALKEVFADLADIRGQLINVGKGIVAAFTVDAIIQFGKESINAFQEAELNAKKLQSAVVTIGGEGNKAFQKLIDQSEKLQSLSIFSDDAIQQAQTQLVQFGLTSSEVENLIPKILDLASATGMDLGQATDTVIQGVNGLTRGLKPLGLEFKNTGDKAQNLAIVSEKLGKFQGQATEVLRTSSGELANLANRWDNVKEKVGEYLTILVTGKEASLSDQIALEQSQLNSLAVQLQDTNIKEDERRKIIDKMIEINPDLIEGYDKEKISNEELFKRLESVNKQYMMKITLARFDEKHKDDLEDLADAQIKYNQRATDLNTILYKNITAQQANEIARKNNIKVTDDMAIASAFLHEADKRLADGTLKYNKNLADLLAVTNNATIAQKEQSDAERVANQITNERNKLQQMLEKSTGQVIKATKDEEKAKSNLGKTDDANTDGTKKNTDAKKENNKATEEGINLLEIVYERQQRANKQQEETLAQALKIASDLQLAEDMTTKSKEQRALLSAKLSKDETLIANEEYANQLKTINERYDTELKKVDFSKDQIKEINDTRNLELQLAEQEHQNKLTEISKKGEDQRNADMRAGFDVAFQAAQSFNQMYVDLLNFGYNYDKINLDKSLKDKSISQAEYDEELRKLNRQKAEREKAASIFAITLNTAQAVIKSYADGGLYGPILAGIAAIAGATQLGIAIATPIPEFAKGTAFLKRGKNPSGIDTIPAMLNEGEAVIPTERNLENPGLADAWIKGNLEQYINNKYVVPALKANRKGFDDESFINKLSKSMSLNAAFNDGNLLESDRMSRRLLMEQNQLLKKIANGSNKNPYRF